MCVSLFQLIIWESSAKVSRTNSPVPRCRSALGLYGITGQTLWVFRECRVKRQASDTIANSVTVHPRDSIGDNGERKPIWSKTSNGHFYEYHLYYNICVLMGRPSRLLWRKFIQNIGVVFEFTGPDRTVKERADNRIKLYQRHRQCDYQPFQHDLARIQAEAYWLINSVRITKK